MNTVFVTTPDGVRIAYSSCGAGPALMLVHGGGSSRAEWQAAGYVERLSGQFTVITPDLRGHGASDQPTTPADYSSEILEADLLAVADACGASRFSLWGMSYGGKLCRALAAHSGRVERLALLSAPFGPAAQPELRQEIERFCARWTPIVQAQNAATLDPATLAPEDRAFLEQFHVPAMLGWGPALLDWPTVEPSDLRCPTLWLAGSEDAPVMASVRAYAQALAGTPVQLQVLEGLDHGQVFDEIERVLPILLEFMQR